MPLPPVTPLQFAILEALLNGKRSGRQVRVALAAQKIKKSGPAFYQIMARLEDAKWVEGWYEQKIIDGQIIRERWYRILGRGIQALNTTREFYSASTELRFGKVDAHDAFAL